jgi:hypothetical protein
MPMLEAECLSMDAANRHGLYRFADNGTVFYVQIHPNANLDDDDFAFVPAIRKILTPRPPGNNWADVKNGNEVEWTHKALKGISSCWHPTIIDLRELRPLRYFSPRTCKVIYNSRPAFAKFARFEYEIPWIDRETLIYRIIQNKNIAPRFLGHLAEEGRVIGILVEYISDTRCATIEDLDVCLDVMRRLHQLRVLHNDVNAYNFLIRDGCCWLCDFEDSQMGVNDERLEMEEESLRTKLLDLFRDGEDDWSTYGQRRLEQERPGEYRI